MFKWLKSLFGVSGEEKYMGLEPDHRPSPTKKLKKKKVQVSGSLDAYPKLTKKKKKKKRTLSSQVPKKKRQRTPLAKPKKTKLKGIGLDDDMMDDVLELFEPTEDRAYDSSQQETYDRGTPVTFEPEPTRTSYGGGGSDNDYGGGSDDSSSDDD